jgi:hypothetical protein
MENIINFIKDQSLVVIIIICLLLFGLYSMFAVFLNKVSNVKYGKPTILAWIPVLNIFLLGRLAIHWIVGILLVLALLFGVCVSFDISGLESIHNLLPSDYVIPYQIAFAVIIVIMAIIAKAKYNKIVRSGTGKDSMTSYINKDYDNRGVVVSGTTEEIKEVEEAIKDNYNYNHTSLSSLNSHNDDNTNNPTN